jgi:hypothetical protein
LPLVLAGAAAGAAGVAALVELSVEPPDEPVSAEPPSDFTGAASLSPLAPLGAAALFAPLPPRLDEDLIPRWAPQYVPAVAASAAHS